MTLNSKTQYLIDRATGLLSTKTQLNSFWQNIAYNFYPQRAFFTRTNPIPYGTDFAANLTTSFPLLVRRDLASAISSYLRPSGQQWFTVGIANKKKDENLSNESRKYLEWVTEQQTNFINDRDSGFKKAVDQGDSDFATFGQCVISIEVDWNNRNLLHRCWNMRDVAWSEGVNGVINYVCREWNTTIREANKIFSDKLSAKTQERLLKEGDSKIRIYHMVMETEEYYTSYSSSKDSKDKIELPFTSIFVEAEEGHEIEVVGSPTMIYCIPRWETVSGSQYAYSPAVISALPDARLLQSITLSLLEAGEKAVNPPVVAKEQAVRSDIALMPNSISWLAKDYDGPIDNAIKVMNLDRSGLQYGLTMQAETREMLKEAFYLNKLQLPQFDGNMTATEVRQRIQEWIRSASPLFGSMETEYNQQMVQMQFDTLSHVGAFGGPEVIPEELRGEEIEFSFTNPLAEARGSEKGQKLLEMQGLIAQAINLDPSIANIPDATIALRDALEGIGIPAKWLKDEDVVAEINEAQAQAQQTQQYIETLNAGGQAAEQVGKGAEAIQQAGLI